MHGAVEQEVLPDPWDEFVGQVEEVVRVVRRTPEDVMSCDGTRSVPQIAEFVGSQAGEKVSDDFVWLAIDQLSANDLLEKPVESDLKGISRRDVIKRIGRYSIPIHVFEERYRATGPPPAGLDGAGVVLVQPIDEFRVQPHTLKRAATRLTDEGACTCCGAHLAGRWQKFGKPFGSRRIPVRLSAAA